jgi:hypothetical protein
MSGVTLIVDGTVVLSVAAALAVAPGLVAGKTPGAARSKANSAHTRLYDRIGPGTCMALVVAVVYISQFLFNAYMVRVHGGKPGYIAHYVPSGWFDLARGNSFVQWLARHLPAPNAFSATLLRVQASLELPFVMLGYMTALRWLNVDLYRRVARSSMNWLVAGSYTVVFCTVEWSLRNPYTVEDILIRLVSGIATPLLIRWLANRPEQPAGRRRDVGSYVGLVIFGICVCALGYLVLAVYNTALLYNLGLLGPALPHAAIALLVLAACRWAAGHQPRPKTLGAAYTTFVAGISSVLVFFYAPALAVGVGLASPALAGAAVLLLGATAVAMALRAGMAVPLVDRFGAPLARWALPALLGLCLTAALIIAYGASRLDRADAAIYFEAEVLKAFCAGLVAVALGGALIDRRWSRHPDLQPSAE